MCVVVVQLRCLVVYKNMCINYYPPVNPLSLPLSLSSLFMSPSAFTLLSLHSSARFSLSFSLFSHSLSICACSYTTVSETASNGRPDFAVSNALTQALDANFCFCLLTQLISEQMHLLNSSTRDALTRVKRSEKNGIHIQGARQQLSKTKI